MKAITLRNVPEAVAQRIRLRASRSGTILNQTVIEMLTGESTSHGDLDALAGTWSADEADAFDRELSRMRTVDPGLWT